MSLDKYKMPKLGDKHRAQEEKKEVKREEIKSKKK